MRKILFRGKRKDNGNWIYGTVVYPRSIKNENYVAIVPIIDGESVHSLIREVIPETVGQFTGLYDKNDQEIFEGDIIEYKGLRWDVGFQLTAFAAMDGPNVQFALFEQYIWDHKKREWLAPDYFEVVGNFHDNPELLEGE